MRHVEAVAFIEDTEKYLSGTDSVAVEQDGEVIGYYRPLASPSPVSRLTQADLDAPNAIDEETAAIFAQLRAAVQRALDESGMTEDELADALTIGEGHDLAPRR